ncbi:MAG: hypothetical protein AVDCRST_MAG86-3852, partial [uncultured Truepera sp.]
WGWITSRASSCWRTKGSRHPGRVRVTLTHYGGAY